MTKLHAPGEVRRTLGLSQRAFEYLLERNPHLEPERLGRVRAFTDENIEAMREVLRARKAAVVAGMARPGAAR